MEMLSKRLLSVLNEEDSSSTLYHIALVMLEMMNELSSLSINEIAERCSVSKSTISKFIRSIGYEEFSDFREASVVEENKNHYAFNFYTNVMGYIAEKGMDSYVLAVQRDIMETYQNMDWNSVDQLVKDLYHYPHAASFGLLFSETAAQDLQTKLAYNHKFIVTSDNDLRQSEFIEQAGKDTLLVLFSDSGSYLDNYRKIEDFTNKTALNRTRAKVVLITSNGKMKEDPRVSYIIQYRRMSELHTHRVLYGFVTDLIAYRYHVYAEKQKAL